MFKHGELVGLPFCQPLEYGHGILGYVSMSKVSLFGSIYDIAANRVVENVLWVVLANLDLVPVWVALVFVTRGYWSMPCAASVRRMAAIPLV